MKVDFAAIQMLRDRATIFWILCDDLKMLYYLKQRVIPNRSGRRVLSIL